MNKIVLILLVLVFNAFVVSAGDSFFVPSDTIPMSAGETKTVDYCIEVDENMDTVPEPAVGYYVWIDLVNNGWCKDVDDFEGCFAPAGDIMYSDEITITVLEPNTQEDGCSEIQVELSAEADGKYYFSLNGDIHGVDVKTPYTKETAEVYVPEFTALSALGILAIAGVYIKKKRN